MAGYWPSSFFGVFLHRDGVEVHKIAKKKKKEGEQYAAILTEKTWSIKDLLYGFRENFSCGTHDLIHLARSRSEPYNKPGFCLAKHKP